MFAADGKSNYDAVLAELLVEANQKDAGKNAPALGGTVAEGLAQIPLFGLNITAREDGIYSENGKLDTVGSILVIRYLLTAGDEPLRNAWVPYRDFRDGARFASYIKANIEDRLAKAFSGNAGLLRERILAVNGVMYRSESRPDVAAALYPFPKVPLLLIFWDKDDEFVSSLQFLFDRSAESYLDLEALAVLLEYTCQKLIGEP
jgi:hypothetical protein